MTARPADRPEMFEPSEMYPFWRGRRAAFVRGPLIAGIATLKATLVGARWVVMSVETTHDYDGMWESVGEIIPVEDRDAGVTVCHELLSNRTRELFVADPSRTLISEAVLPRSIMPATGSVIGGDPLPAQICSVKVGNKEMYDSVYARCYVCSAAGPSDPLTNLLERYASAGLASLDGEFVSYLTKLGEKQ